VILNLNLFMRFKWKLLLRTHPRRACQQVLFIIAALLCTRPGFAQTRRVDSLSQMLTKERIDSNRVTLLWQIGETFQSSRPDTSLELAQKALLLARRINFQEGESRSLAIMATSQYLLGDYPGALGNYMQKLRLEEQRNSPRNYASALNNIGLTYILLEDYVQALQYLYRADLTTRNAGRAIEDELQYSIAINLGECYYRMNTLDSSDHWFENAMHIATQKNDSASIGSALLGKANVLAKKGNDTAALKDYRVAYQYLANGNDDDVLSELNLGEAKVFERLGITDSAKRFAMNSYIVAQKSNFPARRFDAAMFLSDHFAKLRLFDSAYSYLSKAADLKDEVKGREKIQAALILSMNEKLRQAEMAEQKLRDKETRFRQLQLILIALAIPMLFLFTLLISRIHIHRRVITFLGILSLLFLFEFLTLLLHPVVADFTHHVPVLELIVFVIIGALLVPAHHRLEHALIAKLTHERKVAHPATNDETEVSVAQEEVAVSEEPTVEVLQQEEEKSES
jgi:tetratricopeptide (TPR) repeat protein